MVDVGRAVGPLVGARQRRHAALGLEGKSVLRLAVVQPRRQVLELRREEVPVVEDLLQAGRDVTFLVRPRRAAELASLITKLGGVPFSAPAVRLPPMLASPMIAGAWVMLGK